MTPNKLEKIKREIAKARRRSNTYRDLAAIAISLGRRLATGAQARGKEPVFISTVFSDARGISIPNHSSRDIPTGTARNILNDLEWDVLRYEEEFFNSEERGNDGEDSEYIN